MRCSRAPSSASSPASASRPTAWWSRAARTPMNRCSPANPRRAPKAAGDSGVCGSINTGGVLEIRATRVGAESTLARIVRTVEQAAASRTQHRALGGPRGAPLHSRRAGACRRSTFAGWQWRTGKPADRADARHRRAGDRLPLRAGHRHAAGAHRRRGAPPDAAASWSATRACSRPSAAWTW